MPKSAIYSAEPVVVLTDPNDIDLAVKLRAAIRRAINRGDVAHTEYFAGQATELAHRRAEEANR